MKLREMILFQLEHYNQMQAEIDTLKFEMKNLNRMQDEEIIEALTFSSFLGERVQSSNTSDKTAEIALSYSEKLKKLRDDAKASISVRLSTLVLSINRLDFYISKLPPAEGSVLREYYIENYSWRDLQELKGVSAKTLIRYRDEALDKLEKIYSPLVEAGFSLTATDRQQSYNSLGLAMSTPPMVECRCQKGHWPGWSGPFLFTGKGGQK